MVDGSLDFRNRAALFAALEGETFDLLVIGAGITGAGVARDAAMRGLRVCLVDARDIAAGTSSRSSKMIHGGLRYLAQGDLALVQEAASERKAVEAVAPHLTRLVPFVIPARNAAGIAGLRASLWTFEKLGGVPKDRLHEVWNKKALSAKEPSLDLTETHGAVAYPEYLTNDARLTLANVRSAAANGAVAITYAPVEGFLTGGGKAVGAVVGDALGAGGARVRAKVIVNAAGPWVDALRRMEDPAAPGRLQLTRGIHICVPKARLPVNRTIIMGARDRRSVFAVPGGEVTYIGTTDTFYDRPDAWPTITGEDIDYLLEASARRFSGPPIERGEIVAAWAGVRPLVGEVGKGASEISRKDETWLGPAGILSIAGGKLTAYRMMAERIVDRVQEMLGKPVTTVPTDTAPLIGGDVVPADAIAHHGERKVGLYGSEATMIDAAGGDVAAEARHAALHEGALTLEDYWVRRGARAWFDPDGGRAALEPAADAMADLLGWDGPRKAAEITACRSIREQSLAAVMLQETS